tara:strand:+ start:497 stop:1186 length:690 start_codon:yes stop_codon:yes gene_type:complete
MTEKYLYFAKNAARTLTIASQAGQTYTLTTDLVNPIPSGRTNSNDIFANGALKMTYDNIHVGGEDAHVVGSGYGTVVEDQSITVDPSALSYDGTNAVTVQTAAQNPKFGVTASSTAGENDATFTLKVPMVAGDACVWPATAFLGVHMVDNDSADIYFEPQTNDGVAGGVDRVRVSYTAGNFKKLSQLMHDICADSRNQGEMIVVADTFRDIYHGGNPAGITSVDIIALD